MMGKVNIFVCRPPNKLIGRKKAVNSQKTLLLCRMLPVKERPIGKRKPDSQILMDSQIPKDSS